MSYDFYLTDSEGSLLYADNCHFLTGGTYIVGGTKELWLNITFNYAKHFYRVIDNDLGIKR